MSNNLQTQDESNEPRNVREYEEQKGALMNDISAASRESVGKHGTVSQLPSTIVKQRMSKRTKKVKMDQEVKDPVDSVELVRGLFDTSSVLSANDDLSWHDELDIQKPSSTEIEILSNTVFTPIEISRTERSSPVEETSPTIVFEAMMEISRSTPTDSQTPHEEESYNDIQPPMNEEMVPTIHEPDTVAISEPESINMNTATNASMTNVNEHHDEHKGKKPICMTSADHKNGFWQYIIVGWVIEA
jgi:hypothetical protein